MKPLKPLLFLTYRTTVNGIRRAFTSPRRLIGILFIIAYYFWFFIRPSLEGGSKLPPGSVGKLDFPPLAMLDAVLFAVFSGLSLLLAMGIFAYRGGFKPADVDVLFATPVEPKVVLVFRIAREYLTTLLMPLFFILLLFRPASDGWRSLFRAMPNPEYAGLVGRMMSLSWLLVAITWVGIAYAASLFVNRSDVASDRNRKIINWGVTLVVFLVAAYVALGIRMAENAADIVQFAQSPVLRAAFFTATAATAMTMAPITGSVWPALGGLALLLGVMAVSLKLAFTQVGWMYDQAAAKSHQLAEQRSAAQRGDTVGMAANKAREGKIKVKTGGRWSRLRWKGPLALVWKEFLVQGRGTIRTHLLFLISGLIMVFVPVMMGPKLDEVGPYMALAMLGFNLLNMGMNATLAGCMEMLRRVDLQKPLPFPAWKVVAYETFAQSAYATLGTWIPALLVLPFRPNWAWVILGGFVLIPFVSFLISSAVVTISLLLPDADDPSQRQFHRLMTLLAIVIVTAPPVGAFVGLLVVGLLGPLAGLLAGVVAGGLALGVTALNGLLYAGFNPSE